MQTMRLYRPVAKQLELYCYFRWSTGFIGLVKLRWPNQMFKGGVVSRGGERRNGLK